MIREGVFLILIDQLTRIRNTISPSSIDLIEFDSLSPSNLLSI
jgi:hypothetical protein